jgi:hypothetical protein
MASAPRSWRVDRLLRDHGPVDQAQCEQDVAVATQESDNIKTSYSDIDGRRARNSSHGADIAALECRCRDGVAQVFHPDHRAGEQVD